MDTAPNFKPDGWDTNSRASYNNPHQLPRENWRAKLPGFQFDDQSKPNDHAVKGKRVNSSGFTMNSTLFDGTTWSTEKNLHGDMYRTAYRN